MRGAIIHDAARAAMSGRRRRDRSCVFTTTSDKESPRLCGKLYELSVGKLRGMADDWSAERHSLCPGPWRYPKMNQLPTRDQVPVEQTWNLADMYATLEDWERDVARVDALLSAVTAYRGRLGEGPAVLLACARATPSRRRRVKSQHTLGLARRWTVGPRRTRPWRLGEPRSTRASRRRCPSSTRKVARCPPGPSRSIWSRSRRLPFTVTSLRGVWRHRRCRLPRPLDRPSGECRKRLRRLRWQRLRRPPVYLHHLEGQPTQRLYCRARVGARRQLAAGCAATGDQQRLSVLLL
jgi:hypothetical protein